jgi:hypothetical protein
MVRVGDEYTWNTAYSNQGQLGSLGWVKCEGDVIGRRVYKTGIGGQFRRAVKHPAKPKRVRKAANASTRPQARVSRIATAIQAGRDKDAFTVAREVETIIDNHARRLRRKVGAK